MSIRYIMASGKKAYTEQEKIDYIFLLKFRYNNNYSAMARAHGACQRALKQWEETYLDDAQRILDGIFALYQPNKPSAEDESVPTVQELIDLGLKQIKMGIASTIDPSKISKALKDISDLNKSDDDSKDDTEIFEEFNK